MEAREVRSLVCLADVVLGRDKSGAEKAAIVSLALGEHFFRRLPPDLVDTHIPYHCLDVIPGWPRGDRILVRFRSLLRAKSAWGTVYYSRRRPTLAVAGSEHVVAFSDHAFRQICDRTVGD